MVGKERHPGRNLLDKRRQTKRGTLQVGKGYGTKCDDNDKMGETCSVKLWCPRPDSVYLHVTCTAMSSSAFVLHVD